MTERTEIKSVELTQSQAFALSALKELSRRKEKRENNG